MIIVSHRRNTLEDLAATPHELGVEVDIRVHQGALVVQHDPFKEGPRFDSWLDAYRHGLLILNVKEEGLEAAIEAELSKRGIEDFFFLDQSFPFLVRTARRGERRCAVRISEYESIETARAFAGLVTWVWVDCFSKFPISQAQIGELRSLGFRLCYVSPELQGRTDPQEIAEMRALIDVSNSSSDAVCTKRPELWS